MRQVPQVVKGKAVGFVNGVAGLGLALCVLTISADATEPRIEFRETGIFAATPLRREPELDSPVGFRTIITDVRLVETTQTICARMGLNFGTRYTLRGGPAGQPVVLTMITRFPPQGMTTPNGRTHALSQFQKPMTYDADEIRVFGFDEPFEIVVGPWTFEFYLDGRKIGETTFNVIRDCGTS